MVYKYTFQDWQEDKVRTFKLKELLQYFAPDCRKEIMKKSEVILFKIGNEVAENYKASFDRRAYKSLTFPMIEKLVNKEYQIVNMILDKPIDKKLLNDSSLKYTYWINGSQKTIRDIAKIKKWINKFKAGAYNNFVAESPNITYHEYKIKAHFQAFALIQYHAYLKKYSTWEIGLFNALEGKYIASETSFSDFKRMLSGTKESLKNPIVWKDKTVVTLFTFIKEAFPDIEDSKMYDLISGCFVNHKKQAFKRSNLQQSKYELSLKIKKINSDNKTKPNGKKKDTNTSSQKELKKFFKQYKGESK